MAQMREDFDPAAIERVERNAGADPIPDKVIALVELIQSDIAETTNPKDRSKGTAFKGALVIKTGPYEKRQSWPYMPLTHSNAKYAAEGRCEFAEMCDAIGHVGKVRDTQELHFRPFYVEYGVKTEAEKVDGKPTGRRVPKQFIRKYFKKGETPQITTEKPAAGPGVSGGQQSTQAAQGPAADNAPDWMKSR